MKGITTYIFDNLQERDHYMFDNIQERHHYIFDNLQDVQTASRNTSLNDNNKTS